MRAASRLARVRHGRRWCVADTNISPLAQLAIATALQGGVALDSIDLLDRVMQQGYSYRDHVRHLISRAHKIGMLQRIRIGGRRCYRLTPDWVIDADALDAARKRTCKTTVTARPRRKAQTQQHIAVSCPVYGDAPLVPSVGLVCGQSQEDRDGELPPYLGVRLVESLQRHFDPVLSAVE